MKFSCKFDEILTFFKAFKNAFSVAFCGVKFLKFEKNFHLNLWKFWTKISKNLSENLSKILMKFSENFSKKFSINENLDDNLIKFNLKFGKKFSPNLRKNLSSNLNEIFIKILKINYFKIHRKTKFQRLNHIFLNAYFSPNFYKIYLNFNQFSSQNFSPKGHKK